LLAKKQFDLELFRLAESSAKAYVTRRKRGGPMNKDQVHGEKWLSLIFVCGSILLTLPAHLKAAERIHTAYFSPAPGASAVIWVAKEARLFEKQGLDVAPVLIPSSVRTLQAILAGESAIAESAGPAVVSARLAGGDVVAIAGSVNILTYYFVTLPTIKRAEDLKGKIGANQSPGTIADFALRVSLRKLGLDPAKDVSLRSIGVLYDRIAAMQKGIVQFTVLTEAEKPIVDKLGFPVLLDLISLKIPFPQRGIYTTGKYIKEQPETVRRYMRAYVEAIHYFKTRKEETIQILRKYSRVEDRAVLEHTQSWFTRNMPEYPYPPLEGYQSVVQEMAATQPKAATLNTKELVDARFVKELEDVGFIANLSKK
jgi:ABC-type nitrate/sulfonate/bicarbonate transport system substrate-binding protein